MMGDIMEYPSMMTTSCVIVGKSVPHSVVRGEYLVSYTERGVEARRVILI
jgi:hypothetical protein